MKEKLLKYLWIAIPCATILFSVLLFVLGGVAVVIGSLWTLFKIIKHLIPVHLIQKKKEQKKEEEKNNFDFDLQKFKSYFATK